MKNLFDEIKVLRLFFDDDLDKDLDLDIDPDKDKDLDKDKTYTKEEFDKAIVRRQTALKGKRTAEEKAKDLETKLATLPDEEEFNTLKESYATMQQTLKDLEEKHKVAELDKIEDEKERERAKLTQEFKKEADKYEGELEKLRTEITQYGEEKERQAQVSKRYRRQALEGDVAKAAATKAFNPKQIVRLLADEFSYDETDDRWYKEVLGSDGKLKELLAVEEYVEAFLNDPINENLLKADVKSGSGTKRGKEKDLKPDTFVSEEPSEEMWKWNEKQGFNIDKKSSKEDIAWLVKTFNRLHRKVKEKEKE